MTNKNFILLITNSKDNDNIARQLIKEHRSIIFSLAYIPPYNNFEELKRLQLKAKEIDLFNTGTPHIIMDISNWLGHENEDYFIVTLKFLADQSYKWKYIFTVGDYDRSAVKSIFQTIKRYLYGDILEIDELEPEKDDLRLDSNNFTKENYQYESVWERYTYPKSEAKFATKSELLELFEKIKLEGGEAGEDDEREQKSASGIPLMVDFDEKYAIVNNKTEHTIIFGETGSKKTRCVIRPLITTIASAGDSMIIMDVKGELSTDSKIIGHLKSQNYDIVFIDFKDFNGDGYNVFEHAFRLYCASKTDKAMSAIVSLVAALMKKYTQGDEPIWHQMAEQQLIPTIHILFEVCSKNPEYYKFINILTLSLFIDFHGTLFLRDQVISKMGDINNASLSMLRGFYSISVADKFFSSVIGFTTNAFKDFLMQEKLLKMLSISTFDVTKMYEKPTCIFLIIPDETSAYDEISGLLIDTFYNQLLDVYSEKYQNKTTPACRINWICDEFCNLKINDMKAKISASRSRKMRWYLVCQSKMQLENVYIDAATTILGNCKNTIFLQSNDLKMLEYISEMCGKTCVTDKDDNQPLISVERLKTLKKFWEFKEAIFLRDDLKYFAILPDIDQYKFLDKYLDYKIPRFSKLDGFEIKVYTPTMLLQDLQTGKVLTPFETPKNNTNIKEEEEEDYGDFY